MFRSTMDRYCVTCHNEALKTANLMLDKANVNDLSEDPELWEKVLLKLQTRSMPPVGMMTVVFPPRGPCLVAGFVWRGRLMMQDRWAYRVGPIVGGVALLAFTGTGDESTDVGAHLLGFVCGFGAGLLLMAPALALAPLVRLASRLTWQAGRDLDGAGYGHSGDAQERAFWIGYHGKTIEALEGAGDAPALALDREGRRHDDFHAAHDRHGQHATRRRPLPGPARPPHHGERQVTGPAHRRPGASG